MSFCREEGKDKIMFMTKEDMSSPSKALITANNDDNEDDDEEPGAILPSGDINWNCPCIGGSVAGPCGVETREAISCFFYASRKDPRAENCEEKNAALRECMIKHSALYDIILKKTDIDDELDEEFKGQYEKDKESYTEDKTAANDNSKDNTNTASETKS